MGGVRVHLDELGVERIEILPEKGELAQDAFTFVGSLGQILRELDRAIRKQSLGSSAAAPRIPGPDSGGDQNDAHGGSGSEIPSPQP